MTINTFFIIYKGAKGLGLHKTPLGIALGIAFGTGTLSSLATLPFIPKLKKFVENKFNKDNNNDSDIESKNDNETEENKIDIELTERKKEYNIQNENELNIVTNIHKNAEKFDDKTEYMFRYLQIFTAICDSFSHGANDVANAIGPFAAIWAIQNSVDFK